MSRTARRRGLLAAAAACSLLLAGGCSPGESTDSPAAPSGGTIDWAGFKGKTMTYVYFADSADEEKATRQLIGKFGQETGAKVNLQIVPFDTLQQSLQARLSGDNVPEVARLTDIHPFRDDLLDLSGYLGKEYVNEYLEGPAQTVRGADGQLLAVPSDLTINGPFVNVDQFTKAGVPVPKADGEWTFDEMVQAAEKVQQANRTPYALALDKSGHRVSTILSQYGTAVIGPDGKEGLDTAKAESALGRLTDLLRSDKISKDFWLESGTKYKGANEIFLAAAAPVYLSGNWQVAQFAKNAKFRWAAVPNPCAERCGGYPGGKFMAAFERSKEPALAAGFIQWMNRAENQKASSEQSLFLPTRKDLVSQGLQYPRRGEDMAVFLSDIPKTPKDAYLTVASPAFGSVAKELVTEISKVVAGQQDVPAAVATLKKQTAQLVEESR